MVLHGELLRSSFQELGFAVTCVVTKRSYCRLVFALGVPQRASKKDQLVVVLLCGVDHLFIRENASYFSDDTRAESTQQLQALEVSQWSRRLRDFDGIGQDLPFKLRQLKP